MTGDRWRERAWAAHPEVLALGAAGGGSGRSVLRVGAVVGADLGVPYPWAVQLAPGALYPANADAQEGLAWCRERGLASGWRVSIPEELAAQWGDLVEHERMGVFATDAATAAGLRSDGLSWLELARDPSRAEVVAAYGGQARQARQDALLLPWDQVDRELWV